MAATKAVAETPEQKRNRETIEGIADNIAKLADSVSSLLNGPLKRKALVVLLASSARMSQVQIEVVLAALADLKKDWLR